MSKLEDLLQELCPNGVEYKKLGSVAEIGTGNSNGNEASENGKYPFFIRSNTIKLKNDYEYDEESIIIPGEGGVGEIFHYISGKYALHQRVYRIHFLENDVITKFAFYYMQASFRNFITKRAVSATVRSIRKPMIEQFTLPIPPLEVQQEIVRILDQFTELTAELTAKLNAELTARKKQYEYYRDALLGEEMDASTEWKTIGEISSFRRGSFPQPYGNKEWYDGEGAMPFVQVADIGENMLLVENTKRKISVVAQPKSVFAPKGSIVISLQGSIGRIAVTQYDAYIDRTVAIFKDISSVVLPKYFVYQLQRVFSIKERTARGSTIKTITKEEFTGFQIPIPSLEEQRRIVSILDRFDALCNDLTSGLPAEIDARQKQYEYYRDKLLTFKELEV